MFSNTTKNTALDNLGRMHQIFNEQKPFPHIVIDNFLDEGIADECLHLIESNDSSLEWLRDEHWAQKSKKWIQDCRYMPRDVAKIIWWMHSASMLSFVEGITGIQGLISDSGNEGGGIHCTSSGGKLNVHTDFNKHEVLGLKRRVNVLLFLNKDWDASWEGNLELWKTDRSQCGASIEPIFNRLVIFNSFKYAYHGVPKILCPEDKKRLSIAMYYYTFEDQENLSEEEVKNIATFYQTY